jgi:hypothetical protein
MSSSLSLKELERQAFRPTHQDGLWDIYIGGVFASFAVFAGMLWKDEAGASWSYISLYLAGMAASYLVFWAGKKYITTPRLGQVRFGVAREKRKRSLAVVLSAIIAVQALVVGLSIALWKIPALGAWFAFDAASASLERLAVAIAGALFVGPSLAVIAHFNDFTRGYLLAIIASMAVFTMIWFTSGYWMLFGGAIIISIGCVCLVRFVLKYPLSQRDVGND